VETPPSCRAPQGHAQTLGEFFKLSTCGGRKSTFGPLATVASGRFADLQPPQVGESDLEIVFIIAQKEMMR